MESKDRNLLKSKYQVIQRRNSDKNLDSHLWKSRFWNLLIAFILLGVAVFLSGVLFHHFYKNENVNCNPKTVQEPSIGYSKLPENLQNQLRDSIPRAKELKFQRDEKRKPNILLILADDMGYGDLSIYGHPTQPWGPLDEMASKGMRFSQFYAEILCTPSRAQMLTGRYAVRSGLKALAPAVFEPDSKGGLPDNETTIPELLKTQGYVTGFNGKWHLGINCENKTDGCHLPFHHGFDEIGTYFPFSNHLKCDESKRYWEAPDPKYCFLYRGKRTEPWQAPVHHEPLTPILVNETKEFITRNKDRPWFHYYASPQVHNVVYSSKKFQGSTARGGYGDALNEMNWAAGELVSHLQSLDLLQDTLIFFFSDNGGAFLDCGEGGNNGMLKSGKGTYWEGGVRADAFAYWPGVVPEGVLSHEILSSVDLLPTFAKLSGARLPDDRVIDGVDMTNILTDDKPPMITESRVLFFYCGEEICAVRYGKYKIHYSTAEAHGLECYDGLPAMQKRKHAGPKPHNDTNSGLTPHDPPLIYNLAQDPGENYPLDASTRRDLLDKVKELVKSHQTTVIHAENQLQMGQNSDLNPCSDPEKHCLKNYPLENQFDFSQF